MPFYRTFLSAFAILFLVLIAAPASVCAAEALDKGANSAIIITSPQNLIKNNLRPKIFLAGSIEMGKASDWQSNIIAALNDTNAIIYNPRRADWNKEWKTDLSDPHFKQQVEWELSALEDADIVIMYLAPDTQSPISLLELGLYARTGKLILYCPEGFWRKGNVDAVAQKYNIKTVNDMNELINMAKARLQKAH